MKLSIITINKNNAAGLQKTMKSVFSQSWQDFEYIIIDGASIDESVEIIKNNADKLSYWISEKDSGVYEAMNKGIRVVKGEYLLFLNSGDFLVNETVLQQIFEQEHIADILCGRCNVSDKGKVVWTSDPPEKVTFGTLYNVGLAHQSTFIRRNLFERLGLYREDFKYNADIEFWYRSIILGGAGTETINLVVADYNLEGISAKESKTAAYQQEIRQIFDNPKLQLFVPDYERWRRERAEMQVMYWAKSKSWLYFFIKQIYTIAGIFTKNKNKN